MDALIFLAGGFLLGFGLAENLGSLIFAGLALMLAASWWFGNA
jgi:hypothetical protein